MQLLFLSGCSRQTIRDLLHRGKNYVQIAEILKKSPTTISREIEKHKVKGIVIPLPMYAKAANEYSSVGGLNFATIQSAYIIPA